MSKKHPNLEPRPCACGCGEMITPKWNYGTSAYTKYKLGHCNRGRSILKSRKLSLEQEEEIGQLYQEGRRTIKIAKEFGVRQRLIYDVLKRQGISSTGSCAKGYKDDSSFFQKIDSERKAYWLGFIAADGCVENDSYYSMRISLARCDEEHLRKFKRHLKSNRPLHYSTSRESKMVNFTTSDHQIIDDLVRHGIKPLKTYSLKFPTTVPDHLLRHFIRGYFDGDGTVYITNKTYGIGFCGTKPFLERVRDILVDNCNLRRYAKVSKRKTTRKMHRFSYCGNRQCPRIIKYLYHDTTVYLDRKAKYYFKLDQNCNECRLCGDDIYLRDLCQKCSCSMSWNPRSVEEEMAICKRFCEGTPIQQLAKTTRFTWSVINGMLIRQGVLEENIKVIPPYSQLALPLIGVE